jgi:hypothetical protein
MSLYLNLMHVNFMCIVLCDKKIRSVLTCIFYTFVMVSKQSQVRLILDRTSSYDSIRTKISVTVLLIFLCY